MRHLPPKSFALLLCMTVPAAAQDQIGTIAATFDGAPWEWHTIRITVGDETDATGRIYDANGMGSVSIQGHTPGTMSFENAISIEATFFSGLTSGARADMVDVAFFPTGMSGAHWSSSEVEARLATITFDLLEITEAGGRAEGSFEAVLCRVDPATYETDQSDCKDIAGTFATDLIHGD